MIMCCLSRTIALRKERVQSNDGMTIRKGKLKKFEEPGEVP
jgi:hypothetical protein